MKFTRNNVHEIIFKNLQHPEWYFFIVLEPDDCASGPCENGGLCTEDEPYIFSCNCTDGFTGAFCECKSIILTFLGGTSSL